MASRIAHLTWLTPEQGGRHSVPAGPRYIAPARFDVPKDQSECGAWSLIVDLQSRPPGSADWIAAVRFLVPEAPHEWLKEGVQFHLYEGKKCVAHGAILAPSAKSEIT